MSHDMPKALRDQATSDGWSQHTDPDPDSFATYQQLKALQRSPAERTAMIEAIDNEIANGGETLRKKAQLLDLRRRLSFTHEQMLKAKR